MVTWRSQASPPLSTAGAMRPRYNCLNAIPDPCEEHSESALGHIEPRSKPRRYSPAKSRSSNSSRGNWKCLEPIPTTLRFGRWQANRTSGPLPGGRARNSSITPQISASVGTARFDRPFATHSFARFESPGSPGYILISIFACTENDNGSKDFGIFCGGIIDESGGDRRP